MRTKHKATRPYKSDKISGTELGKALESHGYSTLMRLYQEGAKAKSSVNICPGCDTSSMGKKTSHAHSCVSRKTLEMAFRYGLCEFYAAASMPLRDRDTVVRDSIDLNGEGNSAWSKGVIPATITESLDNLDNRFAYALGPLKRSKHGALAQDLADTIQKDLHTVLEADVPADYKRAFVSALCTAYRYLVLRIAAVQAPRPADKFLRMLMLVAAVDDESTPHTFDMAGSFGSLVSKSNDSAGSAINWIDANALNWATQGRVEFGKQCVDCENAQGDEDLSRRLIDFMIAKGFEADKPIPAHESYGKLFADLYPNTDDVKNTVWDLSNAVTCTAVEIFYGEARSKYRKDQPGFQTEFAGALFDHLEALPDLFIAYMEVLMLDLAHADPFVDKDNRHRIVKLLAMPKLALPVEQEKKADKSEESDDEPYGFEMFLNTGQEKQTDKTDGSDEEHNFSLLG